MAAVAQAGNWPAWRGPHGTGISDESNLPLHWNPTNHVRWRVSLPERGNSTPIVWGRRVFVTQALTNEGRRTLLCFDRRNGRLLWQNGVTWTEAELTHETNPYCSASPVTDGQRVIASFGSAGLACYDLRGRALWRTDLGRQVHIWGHGASPILHGELCILNFGPGPRTFLVALNKQTGKIVWQVDEPGGRSGQEAVPGSTKEWVGSWATPIVIPARRQAEVVMAFPWRVCAFDPRTGREEWTCQGLNALAYTSPLYAEGIVVAMGGFNGMSLAVRSGGQGEVTATHRLWHHPRTRQRIGSGVISDGRVFVVDEPGIVQCLELATGRLLWEQRLPATGPVGASWSSLALGGGQLYALNQGGDTFVLRAGPKFELLAINPLRETTMSSPAMSNGDIFIRTHRGLWCIGEERPGRRR
jgi:outer membrane protein assembly factor BamB